MAMKMVRGDNSFEGGSDCDGKDGDGDNDNNGGSGGNS